MASRLLAFLIAVAVDAANLPAQIKRDTQRLYREGERAGHAGYDRAHHGRARWRQPAERSDRRTTR